MIPVDDLDLLQAYLDRRLDFEATASLEARLKAEPHLVEALVGLAREESILTEWARCVRALEVGRPLRAAPPPRGRRWLLIGSASAAAAALAGLATLLSGPAGNTTAAAALAVLEEFHGDVSVIGTSGRTPARAGQELFSGHELATSGEGSFAAVKFGTDTRLELGADTRISFESQAGRRVVLEEGVLTGERPEPAAVPMVLTTPHAEALVQGTHFCFTAAPEGTLVELEDGRARLTRRSDGKAIDLPSGSLVVARGKPLKPQPLPTRLTQVRAEIDEGTTPIATLAWSHDGRTIATGSADGSIMLWDVGEREVRLALRGHKRPVRGLAFGPRGSWLASVSDEKAGQLRVWDAVGGAERLSLKVPKGGLQAVAISPEGRTIATGGTAGKDVGEVRLWDATTGAERGVLRGHVGEVVALAFSRDGKVLATAASRDNQPILWDLATLSELRTLTGHSQRVNAVAFSPDSRTLATGSRDGSLRLWEVNSGAELRVLQGEARDVRAVAFSPDGRTLASGNGNLAKLWDVALGAELVALKGHKNLVGAVAFSPDGHILATGGWDRTVKLWDVPKAPR
jgi:WD40 repeat protein